MLYIIAYSAQLKQVSLVNLDLRSAWFVFLQFRTKEVDVR